MIKKIDPFVTTLSADPESGFGGGEGATFLSEVGSRNRTPRHSLPKVEVQAPAHEIALRLRTTPGTQVVSRHQERYIDNIAWSLQTSFYPMEFVTSGQATDLLMAKDLQQGVVGYLEQTWASSRSGTGTGSPRGRRTRTSRSSSDCPTTARCSKFFAPRSTKQAGHCALR